MANIVQRHVGTSSLYFCTVLSNLTWYLFTKPTKIVSRSTISGKTAILPVFRTRKILSEPNHLGLSILLNLGS